MQQRIPVAGQIEADIGHELAHHASAECAYTNQRRNRQ